MVSVISTNRLLTRLLDEDIYRLAMVPRGVQKMRLPDSVVDTVKKAGVRVYYADRGLTKTWNNLRLSGELLRYGGWYWYRQQGGKVTSTDEDGPFRSESAAIRDALVKLQLRVKP
jgi:hypothetical protein